MTSSLRRQRKRNIIIAQFRFKRLRKLRSRKEMTSIDRKGRYNELLQIAPVVLHAPRVFSTFNPHDRTRVLNFVEQLRELVGAGRHVHIDFTKTWRMFADGTLYFYAQLYKLVGNKARGVSITCSYPHAPVVEQVLQHVGFFKLLNKKNRRKIKHHTVEHWHSATGTKVDGVSLWQVHSDYEGTISQSLGNDLYSGVVEAMSNCRLHAYPSTDGEVIDKRWWMFSQEKDDGYLSVVFCDLGVGIPSTMRNETHEWVRMIRAYVERLGIRTTDDSLLIKTALEVGKSQTREKNRGNGLADILKVLETAGEGNLAISSGYGCYFYDRFGEGVEPEEKMQNFIDAFPGTLISWKIKVREPSVEEVK